MPIHPKYFFLSFIVVLAAVLACARAAGPVEGPWSVSTAHPTQASIYASGPLLQTATPFKPVQRAANQPITSPTPDLPHDLPAIRTEAEQYAIQAGDTLGKVADRYHITLEALIAANTFPNPNILEVGQVINVPAPQPGETGPSFKVIPDSELVFGPATVGFNIDQFIQSKGGYLAHYTEEVDGTTLTGAQVVARVSYENSVNPRLLLAVLDYQSGWVSNSTVGEEDFPIGFRNNYYKGLYHQLSYAANNLDRGFYLWGSNAVSNWTLGGDVVPVDPTINAGTAAVQYFFSLVDDRSDWEKAVSDQGLFETFSYLFGYPFDYAIEPLLPQELSQPKLQLPFEPGKVWSFTGGPHGGWADGSAWAALDFAPPGSALGCVRSDEWETAVADGVILRAGNGAVILDLDGDGYEQTGWVILYMHVESRDRIQAGTVVHTGDRIGHPSCEGGVSNGTHLHIARRYNGVWIPADQTLPFVMDGWISRGDGVAYNGFLERDGVTIEALEGRFPNNAIER